MSNLDEDPKKPGPLSCSATGRCLRVSSKRKPHVHVEAAALEMPVKARFAASAACSRFYGLISSMWDLRFREFRVLVWRV